MPKRMSPKMFFFKSVPAALVSFSIFLQFLWMTDCCAAKMGSEVLYKTREREGKSSVAAESRRNARSQCET